MATQRPVIVSLQARNRILGRKPDLKKKRTLNDKHERVVIPKSFSHLPPLCFAPLLEAAELGEKRAESIWTRRVKIREREFNAERATFRSVAGTNIGYYHLLMTVFLARLFLRLIKESKTKEYRSGDDERTNRFLVAAMAQREFTQTCLTIHEDEVKRLYAWAKHLKIPKEWWRTHMGGAITVARLAHLFIREGAVVRFSRADEDTNWKIDLIVSFPSRSEGLCVQVKSDLHGDLLAYRTFENIDPDTESDDVRRFVKGVRLFQKKFHGIWIPVEIALQSKLYREVTVRPQGAVIDLVHHMLKTLLDEHESHKTGT